MRHFRWAETMFVAQSSYYLDVKMKKVRKKIEDMSEEFILIPFDDVEKVGLKEREGTFTKWAIRKALQKGGTVAAAARILKMGRPTLVQKIKRFKVKI